MFGRIAIATSEKSWFIPHAYELAAELSAKGYDVNVYTSHKDIPDAVEIVFLLSYFAKVENEFLAKRKHNLVVHESDLPKGKGWAPLFWQIIEGKNEVPVCLIEATDKIDSGIIYLKGMMKFIGAELYDEIREIQASATADLCIRFLDEYDTLAPKEQTGEESFYKKRTPADSELDINKTIAEQFNLLRTVNNTEFPAFFVKDGTKYILKIEKAHD